MMTKQKEIREGLMLPISPYLIDSSWQNCLKVSDIITEYLHSQGVVIKVDRTEPISCGHAQMTAARYSQDVACPLLGAGYVAVEPLIGGDNAIA